MEALARPAAWPIGLAGFLARGGIGPFALPILVMPSVVGISTFIGPNAVTAAGLSGRFVGLAVVAALLVGSWLVLGQLVGTWVDLTLIEARIRRGVLARCLVVRSATLVPLGLVVAWSAGRLGSLGYDELIGPTDLARPFVIRVIVRAPEVVLAVVLAWLLAELVGGIAVRLVAVDGRGWRAALGGAVGRIVRRPIATAAVLAGTVLGSVVLVGPAILATGFLWDRLRSALFGELGPVAGLGAVLGLVATWSAGLLLAGIAATWRSLAWTRFVGRDHRGAGLADPDRGRL